MWKFFLNLFLSLFCFSCVFLFVEEDGCSVAGASCSYVSLENVGQGFGGWDNGDPSVDLQFICNCPSQSGSGMARMIVGLLTGAAGMVTSGALLLLMMG